MASLSPFLKHRFFDSDGNPLAGGLLYTYSAGTSTPLATYTDAGGLTPNANPIVLDANGECNLWLSDYSYKFVLKNSSSVTQWTVDRVSTFGGAPTAIYRWAGTAGGSANALTLTPALPITAYAAGQRFAFVPAYANTTSTTVNVSSLGVKTIKTLSGSNLVGGEMIAGGIYDITYDGTDFFLNETVPDSSVTRAKLSAGSLSGNVKTKTTTYLMTTGDDVILADATSAGFTLTLPTAIGISGKMYLIKKIDTNIANAVTIDGDGSQTIDGSTTATLNTQNDSICIISDGANWQVLDRRIPSIWTTYTVAITGTVSDPVKGTTTIDQGRWRRVGDSIEVRYDYSQTAAVGGGAGSGLYKFSLPAGVAIDTTKFSTITGHEYIIGHGGTGQAASPQKDCRLYAYDTTHFSGEGYDNADIGSGDAASQLSQTNMTYSFTLKFPVSGWGG